jgi:hypothetical protein
MEHEHAGFNAGRDGRKLEAEVMHNLTRPTAWEAVMRIRCSKGLKIAAFHGHFFNRQAWAAGTTAGVGGRHATGCSMSSECVQGCVGRVLQGLCVVLVVGCKIETCPFLATGSSMQ